MKRNDEGLSGRGEARPLAGSHWEWVAAIVSLLLVAAAIGYLLVDATRPQTPPHVVVRVDTIIAQPGGFLLEFEARNLGSRTAADVRVEGTIDGGSAGPESSDATMDFLPGESSRRGGLFFSEDPRVHPVELRVIGYQRP